MGIICLEGASAVGKTTTSKEIERKANACMIPEVNFLFDRPKKESNTWYLECQIERWQMAQEKLKTYQTVILDGDVFQPLSYNWCFDFQIFNQSLDLIAEFYQKEIQAGRIGFPDKYFYLHTNKTNLKYRKENDQKRERNNFYYHLDIIKAHQRYYETLNQFVSNYVKTLEATTLNNNVTTILHQAPSSPIKIKSEKLLQNVTKWLKENKA